MELALQVTLLLACFQQINSARILSVVPAPAYSHQVSFQPLWRKLSQRGHELVILTANPMNDPSLTNIREIDLSSAYSIFAKYNIDEAINKVDNNPIMFINIWEKIKEEATIMELEHPEVQQLLNNQTEHFDLVMVEVIFPTMFAFSERFNCPMIAITSMEATFSTHNLMGNPTHPVALPDVLLPFFGRLDFKQRIISTLYQLFFTYFRNSLKPTHNELIKKYFKNNTLTLWELENKISMLFTNGNPIFQMNRPLGPNTISFAGGIKRDEVLPKHIEDFLNESKEGVILFSLGTNVKSEQIENKTLVAILEAFKRLPYKILWKSKFEEIVEIPGNVKVVAWLPQQAVLKHPNIKLFITHGGLLSVEESIYARVPMLVLPFYADQKNNAVKVAEKGIGLRLDHKTLTQEELHHSILEIIDDKKYRETVQKVADLIEDQPMTGLEKAVWWTEYVIRHKGAEHLRNPVSDIPLYQYYLLDVLGFFLLIATVIVLIVKYLIKKIVSFFKKGKEKKE